MINNPPTIPRIAPSDMFSMDANVDSQEGFQEIDSDSGDNGDLEEDYGNEGAGAGDEQDGIYPTLPSDDKFIEQEGVATGQGEDVTGHVGRKIDTIKVK
jgi:hypothetical protein